MLERHGRQNLPTKQYPAENQQADRIPPRRALGDLSSQHFLLQALLYSMFSCDRYIWFEQELKAKKRAAHRHRVIVQPTIFIEILHAFSVTSQGEDLLDHEGTNLQHSSNQRAM